MTSFRQTAAKLESCIRGLHGLHSQNCTPSIYSFIGKGDDRLKESLRLLFSKLLSHFSWQSPKPIFSFWMPANEAKKVHECGAGGIWDGLGGHDTRADSIDCLPVLALMLKQPQCLNIQRLFCDNRETERFAEIASLDITAVYLQTYAYVRKNSLHLHHCLEPTSLLSHAYCNGLRNHWTQKHLGLSPHSDIG